MSIAIAPNGEAVEIAPGRGDLNRSSVPASTISGLGNIGASDPLASRLTLVGGHTISYAQLFSSQPWVASAVMRLLTWAVRVPLKCYRRTGDDTRQRLRAEDHPLAREIVDPWERGSQASLIMALLG